jgi:DNA-binding HxlR family transcriptional regulator
VELIRKLTRYRWTLLTLAELQQSEGAKFVTVMRRLNASDRAIRQSLDYLASERWVERNPGYGHPLRPEYIVTTEGAPAGGLAQTIADHLGPHRRSLSTDRWALAVLASFENSSMRFTELAQRNAPVSPRALALTLKHLVEAGLLKRTVSEGFPPAVGYDLTDDGKDLRNLLNP